jgi:hypothetical protein
MMQFVLLSPDRGNTLWLHLFSLRSRVLYVQDLLYLSLFYATIEVYYSDVCDWVSEWVSEVIVMSMIIQMCDWVSEWGVIVMSMIIQMCDWVSEWGDSDEYDYSDVWLSEVIVMSMIIKMCDWVRW